MKSALWGTLAALVTSVSAHAAETTSSNDWHAATMPQAIGYMLLFALIGIATAILGYLLFDKCTPGDLHKEIVENKNVAAALVGSAVILGVCIIVAAAMVG